MPIDWLAIPKKVEVFMPHSCHRSCSTYLLAVSLLLAFSAHAELDLENPVSLLPGYEKFQKAKEKLENLRQKLSDKIDTVETWKEDTKQKWRDRADTLEEHKQGIKQRLTTPQEEPTKRPSLADTDPATRSRTLGYRKDLLSQEEHLLEIKRRNCAAMPTGGRMQAECDAEAMHLADEIEQEKSAIQAGRVDGGAPSSAIIQDNPGSGSMQALMQAQIQQEQQAEVAERLAAEEAAARQAAERAALQATIEQQRQQQLAEQRHQQVLAEAARQQAEAEEAQRAAEAQAEDESRNAMFSTLMGVVTNAIATQKANSPAPSRPAAAPSGTPKPSGRRSTYCEAPPCY